MLLFLRRQHAVLLPGVPHGVPGARPAGAAPRRTHHGETVTIPNYLLDVGLVGGVPMCELITAPTLLMELMYRVVNVLKGPLDWSISLIDEEQNVMQRLAF